MSVVVGNVRVVNVWPLVRVSSVTVVEVEVDELVSVPVKSVSVLLVVDKMPVGTVFVTSVSVPAEPVDVD